MSSSQHKCRIVSCDSCRRRKIRCVRSAGQDDCQGCAQAGLACTFDYRPRVRKPYGRPFESKQMVPASASSGTTTLPEAALMSDTSTLTTGEVPMSSLQGIIEPADWLPDAIPIGTGDNPSSNGNGNGNGNGSPNLRPSPIVHFSDDVIDDAVEIMSNLQEVIAPVDWLPDAFPVGAGNNGSRNGNSNRLLPPSRNVHFREDAIDISWDIFVGILNLYYERLYPRLPIVHWPSFSQQLVARRDQHDLAFRSFLYSLGKLPAGGNIDEAAYTIWQLSDNLFSPETRQMNLDQLHERFHSLSKRIRSNFVEASLDWASKRLKPDVAQDSCDYIYLRSREHIIAAEMTLAEAVRMATLLGLHDGSHKTTDFTEREEADGSDRTTGALTAKPMLLHDDDITVDEPIEVEDEYMTSLGCFAQPVTTTPTIAGFVRVTRVFRLLSRVLALIEQAKRSHLPNSVNVPNLVNDRIAEIADLLQAEIDTLPPCLNIVTDSSEQQAAFATCRANILVTQALTRFELLQLSSMTGSSYQVDEMTMNVLKKLNLAASDVIVANGSSMRHKVLFIATFLLANDDLILPPDALSILQKALTRADPFT